MCGHLENYEKNQTVLEKKKKFIMGKIDDMTHCKKHYTVNVQTHAYMSLCTCTQIGICSSVHIYVCY